MGSSPSKSAFRSNVVSDLDPVSSMRCGGHVPEPPKNQHKSVAESIAETLIPDIVTDIVADRRADHADMIESDQEYVEALSADSKGPPTSPGPPPKRAGISEDESGGTVAGGASVFTQAAVDVDVQHSVVAGRDLAEAETSESVARPIEEVTLSSPAANCSNLLVSEQFAAGDESVASAASSEVTWQSCWTPVHCAVAGEGQQEEITSVDLGEQEGDLEDSSRVAGNIGPLPCSGSSGPDGATRTAAVQNSVEPSASNSAAAGVVCGRGRGVRRRSSLKRSSSIFFPSEDEAEYERKKSKVFV